MYGSTSLAARQGILEVAASYSRLHKILVSFHVLAPDFWYCRRCEDSVTLYATCEDGIGTKDERAEITDSAAPSVATQAGISLFGRKEIKRREK